MTIPVLMINGTNLIINQVPDPNTFWLMISSFILVIVTFVGIIISGILTRKSNELTRKELDLKLRAWLRIDLLERTHVQLNNQLMVPWDEYWSNTSKYTLPITDYVFKTRVINMGVLPAFDVIGKFLQGFNKFSREDLANSKATVPVPLMPEENFPKSFTITDKEYVKTGQTPYYIGLLVEYNIGNKTIFKVGKIWKIETTKTTIDDSWI